jgi:dCMP deaminase
MNHSEKWDRKYLELARYIAENWSKDPSTKVGAVLVNWQANQEFIGYNGFPRGVIDSLERLENREVKYELIVHAEVNAILKAGTMSRGSTLYVWPSFDNPPICSNCAKIVIQAGVKEVVGYAENLNDPRVVRWAKSIVQSRTMFIEAGVDWITLTPPRIV